MLRFGACGRQHYQDRSRDDGPDAATHRHPRRRRDVRVVSPVASKSERLVHHNRPIESKARRMGLALGAGGGVRIASPGRVATRGGTPPPVAGGDQGLAADEITVSFGITRGPVDIDAKASGETRMTCGTASAWMSDGYRPLSASSRAAVAESPSRSVTTESIWSDSRVG